MAEIAPLLSDRPRALKRFVNVYRLLKASLPDIYYEGFVTPERTSPHRACISQLALFTSQPRLAPLLVRELERSVDRGRTVSAWCASLPEETCARLKPALDLLPDRDLVTLEQFCVWLPHTTRYLFHRAA